MKYTEEGVLPDKINQLFDYRKLNDLLRIGQLDQNQKFIEHLHSIQTQIYLLDAYLESNWTLEENALKRHWENITSSLEDLGYKSKDHRDLLSEIRKYEHIEEQCRSDVWPTKVSFEKFYSIKSCDVRLIRHLIYTASPALKTTWKESLWKYYDLITEINDDIADLEEDLQTYNGNRFLISILRKGTRKTEKSYREFIHQSVAKANHYFKLHPKQERHHELHDWIIIRTKETLELLAQTVQKVNPEHLSSALLLQFMK